MAGSKEVKVRLHGIDCPEKGQDYGEVAKKHLSNLLSFHQDSVRVIVWGKDRYRRTIGTVYSGEVSINESLLEKGLAWHYTRYDSNQKWGLLQEGAMKAKLNLWSMPHPVPPWEWRKSKKKSK